MPPPTPSAAGAATTSCAAARARYFLAGGADGDSFVFRTPGEAGLRDKRDLIADFTPGEDTIALRSIDADTGAAGDPDFAFIGADAFSATAGELRYRNGFLSGDRDGDGKADLQLELAAAPALTAADVLL